MQSGNQVTVLGEDANGQLRPIGTAVLVAPGVAVMRVADRGTPPSLPLQVLVPVAAGGGRDEHVNVVEVVLAEDEAPLVALRLEQEIAGNAEPDSGEVQSLLGVAQGDSATDKVGATQSTGMDRGAEDDWYCRMFPWLCR